MKKIISTIMALALSLTVFSVMASAAGTQLSKESFNYNGGKDRWGQTNYIDARQGHSDRIVYQKNAGTKSYASLIASNMKGNLSKQVNDEFAIGLGSPASDIESVYGVTEKIDVQYYDDYLNVFDKDNKPVTKETYEFVDEDGATYYQTYYFNENDQVCLIVWH